MNICVVGTGYVGLVTGAVFADLGNDVVCVDNDLKKIEALRAGQMPIYEPGLEEMVVRKYEKNIQDEVKRKLISETYKKAIEEQKLEVLGQPDIEEIQFSRGQPLQFAATVETAPERFLQISRDGFVHALAGSRRVVMLAPR